MNVCRDISLEMLISFLLLNNDDEGYERDFYKISLMMGFSFHIIV